MIACCYRTSMNFDGAKAFRDSRYARCFIRHGASHRFIEQLEQLPTFGGIPHVLANAYYDVQLLTRVLKIDMKMLLNSRKTAFGHSP